MAPNSSALNSRSTLIEMKYLSSSKSKANSCNVKNEQSKRDSKSIAQQEGDIRKDNTV